MKVRESNSRIKITRGSSIFAGKLIKRWIIFSLNKFYISFFTTIAREKYGIINLILIEYLQYINY